jgi:hypothetical protein
LTQFFTQAVFTSLENAVRSATGIRGVRHLRFQLGISTKLAAVLLLSLPLAGCLTGDDSSGPTTFTDDRGVANQPFPANYRAEILAFMRTYLNDPVGVREAVIADPVQRTLGGRLRYVVCLRYSARDTDGNYRPARDRGIVFVDGRLDRMLENATEPCGGASYGPFAELEKMTR